LTYFIETTKTAVSFLHYHDFFSGLGGRPDSFPPAPVGYENISDSAGKLHLLIAAMSGYLDFWNHPFVGKHVLFENHNPLHINKHLLKIRPLQGYVFSE